MASLSCTTVEDFLELAEQTRSLGPFACAQDAAQALVDLVYERLGNSIVLLRVFTTVLNSELSAEDRELVRQKCEERDVTRALHGRTPVLTLLGTRGRKPDWNHRERSQRFRCIPLVSTTYVAALPMLAAQLRSMRFDLDLIDRWEQQVAPLGHADGHSGMLYVRDAALDRDEEGRSVVPAQAFVTNNAVRTVIGCGTGYSCHPALATLFVFTAEHLERPRVEPFSLLLQAYKAMSEPLVAAGSIFSGIPTR